MKDTERRIEAALEQNHALARRTLEADFPAAEFDALQDWQRQRLADTYADLLSEKQFRAAGHFFLEELYGGLAFRERDQQVSKVLPVMKRTMPEHLLHALARAFELQALSLELDMAMAGNMAKVGVRVLEVELYREIYQRTARAPERKRQIELIRDLGLELTRVVQHRLVLNLVKLLRLPARAAGFGQLQDFLEQGLWSFRRMQEGERFVETVYQRESLIMRRLLEGSPSPFAIGR